LAVLVGTLKVQWTFNIQLFSKIHLQINDVNTKSLEVSKVNFGVALATKVLYNSNRNRGCTMKLGVFCESCHRFLGPTREISVDGLDVDTLESEIEQIGQKALEETGPCQAHPSGYTVFKAIITEATNKLDGRIFVGIPREIVFAKAKWTVTRKNDRYNGNGHDQKKSE
jgi:hypothetical protein